MGVVISAHLKGMMLGKDVTAAILIPGETIKAAVFMLENFFLTSSSSDGANCPYHIAELGASHPSKG